MGPAGRKQSWEIELNDLLNTWRTHTFLGTVMRHIFLGTNKLCKIKQGHQSMKIPRTECKPWIQYILAGEHCYLNLNFGCCIWTVDILLGCSCWSLQQESCPATDTVLWWGYAALYCAFCEVLGHGALGGPHAGLENRAIRFPHGGWKLPLEPQGICIFTSPWRFCRGEGLGRNCCPVLFGLSWG